MSLTTVGQALTAYRVDRRLFAVGDVIMPTGEYGSVISKEGRILEERFQARKPPGKPNRIGSLFLFEDLEAAKGFWVRMANGKLYGVSVDPARVGHRGDMSWTDLALKYQGDESKVHAAVDDYWGGNGGTSPQFELLVTEAITVELLSVQEASRKLELKRRHAPWALDATL